MYKILHWLFGWDFVYWSNICDHGIARVRVAADGSVWYWRYRIIKAADRIENHKQVMWLTCHPSKYMGEVAHPFGAKP